MTNPFSAMTEDDMAKAVASSHQQQPHHQSGGGHTRSKSLDAAAFFASGSITQTNPNASSSSSSTQGDVTAVLAPAISSISSSGPVKSARQPLPPVMTPPLSSKYERGSAAHVRELQGTIQSLKVQNDALADQNAELRAELTAVQEDRLFLEKTLVRRKQMLPATNQ